MIATIGMDLVAFQFGVFLCGGEHDGAAVGIDIIGKLLALGGRVAEQFTEHLFHIFVRVVVAVLKDDVIAWHATLLVLAANLALGHGNAHAGRFV